MSDRVASCWRRLEALAQEHRDRDPRAYWHDANRLDSCSLQLGDIYLDWSLQRLDTTVLEALYEFFDAVNPHSRLVRQFAGDRVNFTEDRGALHSAMRGTPTKSNSFDAQVQKDYASLRGFASQVLDGTRRSYAGRAFTDVLHVGIGGSHLGQKLLTDALACTRMKVHFLSSSHLLYVRRTLSILEPSSTLVIVASKSFTTPETMQNYEYIKQWFAEDTGDKDALAANLVLVTSNVERIEDEPGVHFSVPEEVGGRFSVWSAMGLPAMLAMGLERFDELREGAATLDRHALNPLPVDNPASVLALLQLWNTNLLGSTTHAVLPYCPELRQLPNYLQQLEMESLGKTPDDPSHSHQARSVGVLWGGEETDGQHAFHQWLHQGTHAYSADFIAVRDFQNAQERWMLANCLAQQHASFFGHRDEGTPYKSLQGGQGSSLLLLNSCDAKTIGMLIAMYEHKTALLGFLWGINPFDQWGVEYGKRVAEQVNQALGDENVTLEDSQLTTRVRAVKEENGT